MFKYHVIGAFKEFLAPFLTNNRMGNFNDQIGPALNLKKWLTVNITTSLNSNDLNYYSVKLSRLFRTILLSRVESSIADLFHTKTTSKLESFLSFS